jgi:hypothetical protein
MGIGMIDMKICSKTTRICAMCFHWNGYQGGIQVKPRKGMPHTMEYEPEERQLCYLTHHEKSAWNSCSKWKNKFQ